MKATFNTATFASSSSTASSTRVIPSLHRVLADADGSGSARRGEALASVSPRPRASLPRAAWATVRRLNARLEASVVGDALGCASLFAMLGVGLFFAAVFQ